MHKILAALMAAVLLCSPVVASLTPKTEKALESTVWLKVKVAEKEPEEGEVAKEGWGSCSGVYVDKFTILTAQHCVEVKEWLEIRQMWIQKWDGTSARASIIRVDVNKDLALLKVDKEGVPLKLADKRSLGESITVVGAPLGEPHVVTKGIISKINAIFDYSTAKHFVLDAVVLPGNSGGTILNDRGEIVGVLVRSTSWLGSFGASGLGVAVELEEIREFLKNYKRGYLYVD